MTAAGLTSAGAPARGRRAGRRKTEVLEAACRVIADRGADATRFADVAAESGVPVSTLQYYFGSREDLQLAVLNQYAARFVETVLRPAVTRPRGLPRLRALLERWLAHLAEEIEAGCILIAGACEYDDRPGPLHDALVAIVEGWKAEVVRAIRLAQAEGHLDRRADAHQMVFEIYGLMLMLHQDARLLRSSHSVQRARVALARLIETARPRTPAARPARARRRAQ